MSVFSKFQESVSSKIVDNQVRHFNKTQFSLGFDRNYELAIKIDTGRSKKRRIEVAI